jgi:O-antigen/teichoic acid export membrane protein
MSVKKNLIKNGIATGFLRLTVVLEQLLLVPFFIKAWGTHYYGEWLTLTIIPTMMAYANLGLGSAAGNIFVLRYASGDFKNARNAAWAGFVMIVTTLLFSFFIGAIILGVLDYFKIFDKSLIPKHDAVWALSFLMAARGIDFFQQLNESYYRAARKAALSINLQVVYSCLKIVSGITVLSLGGGIILFSLSNLICAIVFNLAYGLYGKSLLTIWDKYTKQLNRLDIKNIAKTGFGYLLIPMWQSLYFQGGTFIVRIILGPEGVVLFNTVRTATRSVNQIFNLIDGSIFPELQFEIGAGRIEVARKIFISALSLVIPIAILGICSLSIWGLWIYEKWTNSALHPPTLMWNLFLLGIGFNALWWTSSAVFKAFNKPYSLSIFGLICSIVSVSASYFLGRIYGIIGITVGYLLLDILMSLYTLPACCKLLGLDIRSIPKDMMIFYYKFFRKLEFIYTKK